jgi:hypothetical protein
MEATPIDFCNTIGFILKNNKDKSNILSSLKVEYNIDPIIHDCISYNDSHVETLNKFPYIASLLTRGNKYLLYFTKVMGENTTLMIDRKIKKDENIIFPKIITISLQGNEDLYDNTLLEIETLLENNKWTLYLTNLLVFRGNYCSNIHIFDRITYLFEILGKITLDKYLNPYCIKVKEFYDLNQLKSVNLNNYQGINFHPLNGKHKTIVLNNNFNYKENKYPIDLIDYDIKTGYKQQLDKIGKSGSWKEIILTDSLKSELENKEVIGQLEKTDRYGLYKVSFIENKTLVNKGFIRFISLENKEEFSKLIEKYKTIRLVLNYNCLFRKWVPIKLAENKPFTNVNEIISILDYENSIFEPSE